MFVDWQGEPLALFECGRPPRPQSNSIEEFVNWSRLSPESYHLLHWDGNDFSETVFHIPEMGFLAHVQPFGDGWLLADARGGKALIFDGTGSRVLDRLDLGDGSQHLQTTPEGKIWVGYFDEGVYGSGIGAEGLVCFDGKGQPLFRYAELAKKLGLPFIDDCYALNVNNNTVWTCYYSDFPLVCLQDFDLAGIWRDWSSASALAVRDDTVVTLPPYRSDHLVVRTLTDPEEKVWELMTPDRKMLSTYGTEKDIAFRPGFQCAGRGGRFYLWTKSALFELP